jgi:hypothetical protein
VAIAEILAATPEVERRIAAGAPTESIAEAARAGGCVTLWDSGLELVRRGETTIEELRRVAAEPVRVVAEPSRREGTPRHRIGWRVGAPRVGLDRTRGELIVAAALLGGQVEVVVLDETTSHAPHELDAVVLDGVSGDRDGGSSTLVVALARDASAGEHVHTLGRDADLVVPDSAHGRVLLATILALLRWRSR